MSHNQRIQERMTETAEALREMDRDLAILRQQLNNTVRGGEASYTGARASGILRILFKLQSQLGDAKREVRCIAEDK